MKKLAIFGFLCALLISMAGAVTLTNPGNKVVNESSKLEFNLTATATSPTGGIFAFSKNNSQVGTLNAATGMFTYTPDFSVASAATGSTSFSVLFTVNDNGDGTSATQSVSITVLNVNRKPTVNAGADQSVAVNKTVTLAGSASDLDGDTPT